MRRLALIPALAAAMTVLADAAGQPATIDVKALFDMYLRGQRDEAVAKAAAIPDLGPFRLRYVQHTPVWVNAAPAQTQLRSAAAAAFLLELTAARLESDWGRFADLIEWTCVQLRTTAPPSEFERSWHAASHALAGRARAGQWMLGLNVRLSHQIPATERPLQPYERLPDRHLYLVS